MRRDNLLWTLIGLGIAYLGVTMDDRTRPPDWEPKDAARPLPDPPPVRVLNGCPRCGGAHYLRRRDLARFCKSCGLFTRHLSADELLALAWAA